MMNEIDLEAMLKKCSIPPHMWGGISRYLIGHQRPGRFLQAVFSNSLVDAIAQADDDNRQILFNYADFLYNELPGQGPNSPWGSSEAVEAWLKINP